MLVSPHRPKRPSQGKVETTNMIQRPAYRHHSYGFPLLFFIVNTAMPPNHDLTAEQSKAAIQWIFKNAENPDRDYYLDFEGAFKTRGRPAVGGDSYILTASYTDLGLPGIPKSN